MSGPEPDPKMGPSSSLATEALEPGSVQAVTVRPTAASAQEWNVPTVMRPGGVPPLEAREEAPGAEGSELGDVPAGLLPGHTLAGRYTVLDKLGQGGMGVVVAAYDSRLDRRVALKLLRRSLKGEGTEGEESRLVREAQAMARLSHPHVVAVYDAGTLEDGSLFIAMEYIQGRTLRRWKGQEPRTWRQVLEAYVSAGRGLAAAHAAGLIHRDFKADNVLVGEDGRVRVTDFGLARTQGALDSGNKAPTPERQAPIVSSEPQLPTDLTVTARPSGSWSSVLTLPGMFMGTPAYMAPELFRSCPADVRSDLFAFCASLYEALFGQLPFRGSTPTELTRAQLEGKVVTPPESSEVPEWVTRTVLWGLQPDPQKRPASMEPLLAALGDDPEQRRRSRLRSAGVALAIGGLATLAVLGWVRKEAPATGCSQVGRQLSGIWDSGVQEQMRKAMLGTELPYAADTFTRVASVLEGYTASWVKQRTEVCELIHQEASRTQSLAVRREYCLERRRSQMRALTELLARGPDKELLPRAVQVAQSLPPLEYCADAKALMAAVPPPEDPALRAKADALQQDLDKVETLLDTGKYKEGLSRADELLRQAEALGYAPLHARALFLGALSRDGSGDYKAAEEMARQAIVTGARAKDPLVVARASGLLYFLVGYREARHSDAALLQLGMEAAVELADDDLIRANACNSEGIILTDLGRYEEARQKYECALSRREKVLGPDHPLMTPPLNNLGNVLDEMGRYEEAVRVHERVLAIREKALGPQHPDLASALGNLGNALTSLGRYDEALPRHERALAVREQALGADHPLVANSLINLSNTLLTLGRYDEALKQSERALALQEKSLGPEHPRLASSLTGLGVVLEELGRYGEARQMYERALAIEQKGQGTDESDQADPLSGLGRVAEASGRYEEARRLHERALALREKALGPEHPSVASSLDELGSALTDLGRYDEAARAVERARAIQEKALGAQHPELAETLQVSGNLMLARGRASEAIPLLEQALRLGQPRMRAQIEFLLARALWEEGKDHPRAVQLATEVRSQWQGIHHPRATEVSRWLDAHGSR
ncbi:serine/threonine-protein kinase [Hyalangium versicolor]|uniref:serine/threonine-protein kinase n=1 Tax=Hyalangium versicolor TaxID=2861190 RepID=UPI001CCFA155|nr:tetratricopeptide repeat protein [Hyalangium versicolor]